VIFINNSPYAGSFQAGQNFCRSPEIKVVCVISVSNTINHIAFLLKKPSDVDYLSKQDQLKVKSEALPGLW
jgi:hypothetical protein